MALDTPPPPPPPSLLRHLRVHVFLSDVPVHRDYGLPKEIDSNVTVFKRLKDSTHTGPLVLGLIKTIPRLSEKVILHKIGLGRPQATIIEGFEHAVRVRLARNLQQDHLCAGFEMVNPLVEGIGDVPPAVETRRRLG